MNNISPKLRTVDKSNPPFTLNNFPSGLPQIIGKEIIYMLATKGNASLEGNEWEQIFAKAIGADWKPSNVGLDDVVLGNTAWGAKTVKAKDPFIQEKVRLISGRNSISYSFNETIDNTSDPVKVGELVLEIWNERVSSIREKYKSLRTVVLLKSDDLTRVSIFEFETIRYDFNDYEWQWNKNNNLIAIDKRNNENKFTWKPHGSQFTITELVPKELLKIRIKKPDTLDQKIVLESLGFNSNWIEVIK